MKFKYDGRFDMYDVVSQAPSRSTKPVPGWRETSWQSILAFQTIGFGTLSRSGWGANDGESTRGCAPSSIARRLWH